MSATRKATAKSTVTKKKSVQTKAASTKAAKKTTATKVRAAAPKSKRHAAATSSAKAPRVSTHPAKKRTPVSLSIIEKLDEICLALPDATMQVAWGEPTWRVKKKIFAQLDDHHHGAAHVSVWLPAPDGAQQALVDSDPDRFFRPPYVGHRGWVAVVLDTDPDWGMVASLIEQAHGMIAGRSSAAWTMRARSR